MPVSHGPCHNCFVSHDFLCDTERGRIGCIREQDHSIRSDINTTTITKNIQHICRRGLCQSHCDPEQDHSIRSDINTTTITKSAQNICRRGLCQSYYEQDHSIRSDVNTTIITKSTQDVCRRGLCQSHCERDAWRSDNMVVENKKRIHIQQNQHIAIKIKARRVEIC